MKKMVMWGLIVIAVVVLTLGTYFGMGLLTERTLRHTISLLDQSNGLWVELTDYNRGLFRSSAKLTWKLSVPEHDSLNKNGQHVSVAAKTYEVPMPLIIQHGPVVISSDHIYLGLGYAQTSMELPNEANAAFTKNYTAESTQPKINMHFSVNYLNNTHVSVSVPDFKVISKTDKHIFEWLGMTNETFIASQGKRIHGTFNLNGLTWQQNQANLVVGPVESSYDLHPSSSGLYMGDAHVIFSSLRILEKGQTMIDLDQLRLESSSNVLQLLFQSQAKLEIEQLVFHGHKYGPMNLDVSVKDLDADVLAKINQKLAESSHSSSQSLLFSTLPELPALLNKGAILSVNALNMKLPEGDVHGSMQLTFPKESISNPIQLSKKISGGLNLVIGERVLKQCMTILVSHPWGSDTVKKSADELAADADTKISSLMKSGVLIKEGQINKVDLKLSNGHLFVNGHPFNASMLNF